MGLAQNEMKAKPALPERVRSMEGLGGAVRAAALALAAETVAEPGRRDTLCIGVVFTTGSVPEPRPCDTYCAGPNRIGVLSPASGPPKDGHPPQGLRPRS